jgi:hypothetical protein
VEVYSYTPIWFARFGIYAVYILRVILLSTRREFAYTRFEPLLIKGEETTVKFYE